MRAIALAMVLFAACKGKDQPAPKAELVDRPVTKVDGPSVTPIVTGSITFAVPKQAPWWGELAFGCYKAAIGLQPGNSASTAFTQISPNVAPALVAGDIDLDHDLMAVGAWGCGDGPCIYLALTLRHPEKLPDLLGKLVPGSAPKTIAKNHFVVDVPGSAVPRTIHVEAVPISWPSQVPSDPWSQEAAHATHVVFLSGLFGKTDFDPLAALADATAGAAKVKDAEGVLADPRGRCLVGVADKHDFQPGYQLERARFGLAAPEGTGDPLGELLGSKRSLDLEVELALAPAPTEAVVAGWITEAKAFISNAVAPVRQQFAAQGPMVQVMFDLGALLGERGFQHSLKDKVLDLSWRTDQIPRSDLVVYEARLQEALTGSH